MTVHARLAAAALTILGLACYLRALWRRRSAPADGSTIPQLATCTVLAAEAVTATAGWRPAAVAIDQAVDIPNLAALVEHIAGLLAALGIQALFLQLTDPHSARRRILRRSVLAAAAVTAMVVLFTVAEAGDHVRDDLISQSADNPYISSYMAIYLASLAAALIDVLAMSRDSSLRTTPTPLRLGTRLLTASAATGLIYITTKAALLVTLRTGTSLPFNEHVVAQSCVIVGATTVTAGLLIPCAAQAMADVRRARERRRLYHDMHPLWLALFHEIPEICLNPPRHPERDYTYRPTGTYRRLYRRVIEILDGIRHLAEYLPPAATDATYDQAIAAGASIAEGQATAKAATIAKALHNRRIGAELAQPPPRDRSGHGVHDVHADVETDAAWLASVSLAYRDSQIVAKALHQHIHRGSDHVVP